MSGRYRKFATVACTLAIAAGLIWVFTSIPYARWSGRFNLTIHVVSTLERPHRVEYQAFLKRDEARYFLDKRLPIESGYCSAVADPFLGDPVQLRIPVGGTDSITGRQLNRTQSEYLVVIAEWPDNRRVGKIVAIPDGRVSREVTVAFP